MHGGLRNIGVNVLGTPSKKESYVLNLQDLRCVFMGGSGSVRRRLRS